MKVLYVTSNGGIHDYRFLKKLAGDFEVLLLHYAADELIDEIRNLRNLKIISKTPLVKSFPLLTMRHHFKKLYHDFKPDIIHTGYVWQVGILASRYNLPHHLSMPWGSDILIEPDKNRFIKSFVRKVMNQCSHIQCDAYFVKEKIKKDYGIEDSKITVFPWGIDLQLFKPANKFSCRELVGIEKTSFVTIFTRHLEPIYGVGDLLEGYKEFCKNKNDVRLIMIADGSLKNDVIKYISTNNLEDKVSLLSRIPNTELPAFLGASDIYISPSLSDGSSLSLLEAMAMGLGLIVTDVPAIREWVSPQNGFAVKKNNPLRITDSLEKYYADRNLIARHGSLNKQIANERADWDKNYQKLKEIYSRILADR